MKQFAVFLLDAKCTFSGIINGSKPWYNRSSAGTLTTLTLLLQVAYLFIIDTLNSVFNIGLVWRYTITLFGELPGVNL
jgi:hypothetical protein